MVETINPVVHGERRRAYRLALSLHILGAMTAAAALGGLLGLMGALAGAPWGAPGLLALAAIAALYALRESAGAPVPLPARRGQVPSWWRSFFSPPVAGLLYGLALGVGFGTYLTFGTFVAVAAAAVLGGDPLAGAAVCAPFGLGRGVAVAWANRGAARDPGTTVARLEDLALGRSPRLLNSATLAAVTGASLAAGL
ncbi:MAG: hypothetical protein H0W55_02000 [Actinobacteria bacterium]|nr:hypothetical protein [Actinomycetota bacterium]MDQ3533228.1 hypothetical protein [Actinomycetota bacterium]